MVIDHVYRVTVVAEGRVHALKILRSALYEQMEQDPSIADHFASIYAARLNHVAAEMRRIDETLAACIGAGPRAGPYIEAGARPAG
jgi:CRP-like cAMP-binding protein